MDRLAVGQPNESCQGSWWGVGLACPLGSSEPALLPTPAWLPEGPFGGLLHPTHPEPQAFCLCPLCRLFTQWAACRGGHAGCSEHRCHLELHIPRLWDERELGSPPEGVFLGPGSALGVRDHMKLSTWLSCAGSFPHLLPEVPSMLCVRHGHLLPCTWDLGFALCAGGQGAGFFISVTPRGPWTQGSFSQLPGAGAGSVHRTHCRCPALGPLCGANDAAGQIPSH